MKRLRVLGLMLFALFALGASFVASASATERGILTLEEVASVTASGSGEVNAKLAAGGQTIVCKNLNVLSLVLNSPGGKHFNLGKDADFHFTGCKLEGTNIACNTPGDEKEVILVLIDTHLINLINEAKELVPGFAALILNSKLENNEIEIKCGIVVIKVKGAALGVVGASLTTEVTSATFNAQAVKCDPENEKVCQEILEKEPLLSNVGKGFEPATETTEKPLTLTTSTKVLWDD